MSDGEWAPEESVPVDAAKARRQNIMRSAVGKPQSPLPTCCQQLTAVWNKIKREHVAFGRRINTISRQTSYLVISPGWKLDTIPIKGPVR